MAADVMSTVRSCPNCAKNRIRLIKNSNSMKLFPATAPLESMAMDLLGPLQKSKAGNRFILVMMDRFTKLTQFVPLRRITAAVIAAAFFQHLVFKYGAPKETLTDNGSQFASKFVRETCKYWASATPSPARTTPEERTNRAIQAHIDCDAALLCRRQPP